MRQAEGKTRAESLATRVSARVSELTDVLVRTIEDQNPGYRSVGVVPQDDLWRSCHDNLTRVLELIADGTKGMSPRPTGVTTPRGRPGDGGPSSGCRWTTCSARSDWVAGWCGSR